MFSKGEKIVYPMYGAGTIEELQVKEIDGVKETYYVLNIPMGNLKISISSKKVSTLNLRSVYEKDEILHVLSYNNLNLENVPENFNDRYKFNLEKIKLGKFEEVLKVYYNLFTREKEKCLSGAEKKLLFISKQMLITEIIVSQDVQKSIAEEMLLSIGKETIILSKIN